METLTEQTTQGRTSGFRTLNQALKAIHRDLSPDQVVFVIKSIANLINNDENFQLYLKNIPKVVELAKLFQEYVRQGKYSSVLLLMQAINDLSLLRCIDIDSIVFELIGSFQIKNLNLQEKIELIHAISELCLPEYDIQKIISSLISEIYKKIKKEPIPSGYHAMLFRALAVLDACYAPKEIRPNKALDEFGRDFEPLLEQAFIRSSGRATISSLAVSQVYHVLPYIESRFPEGDWVLPIHINLEVGRYKRQLRGPKAVIISKEQEKIFKLVKGLYPDAQMEPLLKGPRRRCDIFIPSLNTVLEFYGPTYHFRYSVSGKVFTHATKDIFTQRLVNSFHRCSIITFDEWNRVKRDKAAAILFLQDRLKAATSPKLNRYRVFSPVAAEAAASAQPPLSENLKI